MILAYSSLVSHKIVSQFGPTDSNITCKEYPAEYLVKAESNRQNTVLAALYLSMCGGMYLMA